MNTITVDILRIIKANMDITDFTILRRALTELEESYTGKLSHRVRLHDDTEYRTKFNRIVALKILVTNIEYLTDLKNTIEGINGSLNSKKDELNELRIELGLEKE